MKLNVVNTSSGLVCATDKDFEQKRKLKVGAVYEVTIKEFRNYEFLKKYFALLNCAWAYLTEGQQRFFKDDVEKFRETVQIAAGHYEPCYSIARQEWIERPKSIAFDKLTESDFSALYERVREVIYQTFIPQVNKHEFEEQLKYF